MELFEALARVASASSKRALSGAITSTGEGRAFCAGIDVDVL